MGEREMLELAAKAIGEQVVGESEEGLLLYGIEEAWNPLHDDGQALRLAVKLAIDVQQFESTRMVEAWKHPYQAKGEDYGDDPYAATRLAILRAAAEIGAQQGKGEG